MEQTFLMALKHAMAQEDWRTLGVLTTWFGVHSTYVNAARLLRFVAGAECTPRMLMYLSGLASWMRQDRRFKSLITSYSSREPLLRVGNDFHIARHGEDPRFQDNALCVPAGVLRDRAVDVLSPAQLARAHGTYAQRIIMGPTWRADVWAALLREPTLTASQVAKQAGCAYGTAWQTMQDFALWTRAQTTP
jgi:hypothetical protein